MDIPGTFTAPIPQQNTQPTPATGNDSLGKEEFLQMLVAQLSNQDPLNPLQGHDFAAQLAQFSSLEQLLNINESVSLNGEMTSLLASSMNSGVAAGLIGKNVEAAGNRMGWSGEGEVPFTFELPEDASEVTIEIRNEKDVLVRTIKLEATADGRHTQTWDGNTDDGATAPEGVYNYTVKGKNSDGKDISGSPLIKGKVDRITFGAEGIFLWIGKLSIPMSAVQTVAEDT